MSNFISLDIDSPLSPDAARDLIADRLPEFSWRRGDSDAQGPYLSGVSTAGVRIQCWVGENPMAMSISFRSASMDGAAREPALDAILKTLFPGLGTVRAMTRS